MRKSLQAFWGEFKGHASRKRNLQPKRRAKQKHKRMQMALSPPNKDSGTMKNIARQDTSHSRVSECYRGSEQGKICVFLDGQKKGQGFGMGEVLDLTHEGRNE